MKGYIAICQHFHQPHFQLQNIREKVYSLSYSNWLNLLETLSPINGFYINLHFSGPFLYWIKNEKNDFVLRLTKLIKMGKIGIIGGFADEAFIQLSTRPDDILFQIREYEKLTKTLFNIHASDWQGFHLPERECGETLIKGVTKALLQVHASPIYYLDAETFYECYYSEPGGDADYCCKYFGFNDPVSKTTISHYPKSMLRYAFQDIVEGNKFICFPIHCDERYWFLKCDSTVCIKPVEYLDRIKQALKTSCDNAQSIKKEIKPIAIIFEDAEKFGDWSGNPDRDFEWLYELIDLISKDNEVELIGLKQYYDEQGCFDTYPISTSHSYIEWENWTAHRGIRGVVFSDEKIRKLVARVHLFENRLESFERKLISQYICTKNQRIINAVMNSIDRFEYVSELLATQIDKECVEQYMLLQRLRNMLYQEDSKWAVRHPNYGSAPYFDNMGVCLIEIAERMLTKMYAKCHYSILRNEIHRIDWMDDFTERAFIRTDYQSLSINPYGASLDYYVVFNRAYSLDMIMNGVLPALQRMSSYPAVYRFVSPVVFTETDSDLCYSFDNQGARIETCRNSFVICLSRWDGTTYEQIASFDKTFFSLIREDKTNTGYCLVYEAVSWIKTRELTTKIKIIRTYIVGKGDLSIKTVIETDQPVDCEMYLSVQTITSLTASDEVNLTPVAGITIKDGNNLTSFDIDSINNGITHRQFSSGSNGTLIYSYLIRTGNNEIFRNALELKFLSDTNISHYQITPAVKRYYENFVGKEQSRLGYTSSGLLISPYVKIIDGKADITIQQNCLWDVHKTIKGKYISLVE